MNITEGLQDYERVLLGLGVLLFVVLLFSLIFLVAKNRSIKPLFLFFALSIVMIAFPGIQKIRFEQGALEFDKAKEAWDKHPTPENKKALATHVIQLDKQPNLSENRKKELTMLRKELNLKN
jgi:hypothetical protein